MNKIKKEPLTEKQIEKWRRIIFGNIGLDAYSMSIKDIEKFKDKYLEQLGTGLARHNSMSGKLDI